MTQQQVAVQKLEGKISTVTAGLEPSNRKMLEKLPGENAGSICDYILAEITENNIKDSTKEWKIKVLVYLSRFIQHKSFKEASKDEILLYLNSLRRSEAEDPTHKWIGTYNNRFLVYSKFFRWLYNPDEPDVRKRITPPCIRGIKQLKRKEKSPYKPSDLWTAAEHDVFLRYCPSKRDRCYAAMARDTSARPHELLHSKTSDVQFKRDPSTGKQYAEILVSGKTKARTLPLFDSLPYVKEWLADHPQAGNPQAPLFTSQSDKNHGQALTIDGLWWHFKYFKTRFFRGLLDSPDVPSEDREIIRGMVEKPWNPYILRHTALTEKSQILKEATLRDHAGWTMTSKMHQIPVKRKTFTSS